MCPVAAPPRSSSRLTGASPTTSPPTGSGIRASSSQRRHAPIPFHARDRGTATSPPSAERWLRGSGPLASAPSGAASACHGISRLDLARADLLRPVARDLVPAGERTQLRTLVAAERRL